VSGLGLRAEPIPWIPSGASNLKELVWSTEVNEEEEGLSAYAMDTIPEDLLQQAEASTGMGSEGVNRAWVSLRNPDPAVVETLQELDKFLVSRHLPRLQEWLKVFVKV
jgi:hypothetical protein